MERVFENQKRIEVSLACIYKGSLVLKTDEKSLSKTATFLASGTCNKSSYVLWE